MPLPRNRQALGLALTVALVAVGFTSSGAPAAAASAREQVRLSVRFVDAAGTRFAWAEIGTGRPLLLLSGTGSPMAEWDPALLAGLAAKRRVIVFDYPGLGRSGRLPGPVTFRAMSDWTCELIRALRLDRPDVLGWSMGGFVAQRLAEDHAAVMGRLVLAATNPGGPQARLGPRWVQQADSDPAGTVTAYLQTNYPRTPSAQAAGRRFVNRLTRAVDSGRYPQESTPVRTYRAMVNAEEPWLASATNSKRLRLIRTPTLVVTGREDVITPPANSRLIASLIPGARLVLVEGAGHSFLFQRPRATAELVTDFLATPA